MKKFKTLIITKKKIKRTILYISVLTIFVSTAIIINKSYEPEAISVFSEIKSEEDGIYKSILENGLPNSSEPFSIKKIISDIIGFDTNEPETIIQSSSAVFRGEIKDNTQNTETTPNTDTPPTVLPTENPSNKAIELPSKEQLKVSTGLSLNNATNYNINIDEMCSEDLSIKLNKKEPEVLIVHTHTTECYDGDAMPGESDRTTNSEYNMVNIGNIVAETLNKYGIQTVHDTTIHDYPTYQGAYTNALETINKNMKQYPSIKVVLDIHRDAYVYQDGSKLSVSADINGSKSAQVMIVVGTDSMGLYHPYWKENLKLAAKTQNAAEIMYPGLMRSINLRRERFNMHVTTGSLLFEVGSNGNSREEAEKAAEYIGNALAAALLNG